VLFGAAQYSNAIDFDRASLPSNLQIRALTHLIDSHAGSSDLAGQLGSKALT